MKRFWNAVGVVLACVALAVIFSPTDAQAQCGDVSNRTQVQRQQPLQADLVNLVVPAPQASGVIQRPAQDGQPGEGNQVSNRQVSNRNVSNVSNRVVSNRSVSNRSVSNRNVSNRAVSNRAVSNERRVSNGNDNVQIGRIIQFELINIQK